MRDLEQVDIYGFSLGAVIAQQLALGHPEMVRKMILVGTAPRGGEGLTFEELTLDELKDPVALIMKAFLTASNAGKASGLAHIERLKLRHEDRVAAVTLESAGAQLAAIREWGVVKRYSPRSLLVAFRSSSTACRVDSVSSNLTGRPVFFCRTAATRRDIINL